jgi:hypothetical protein
MNKKAKYKTQNKLDGGAPEAGAEVDEAEQRRCNTGEDGARIARSCE